MSAIGDENPEHRALAEERIAECLREKAPMLDLSTLHLSRLPESVRQLRHLEKLDISGDGITTLPDWLREFRQLKVLLLYHNGPVELPPWLPDLPALEMLGLSDSVHISGWEVLPRVRSLRRLFLYTVGWTVVPDWLRAMPGLHELGLADNYLRELPEWLGELGDLSILVLFQNLLTRLPPSFAKLTQLKELHLRNNKFATVPPVLHELPTLRTLDLRNNPRLSIPAEILENGDAQKILAYARKLAEGAKPRALNEAKLILVGRGAVGKTTLVHQLVHGKFVAKHKTKGIKVSQWEVPGDGEPVTAHVWDFGGQEIMHGTHQFFLTERSLYVLVLAGREDKEDEDAEYWLKMIGAFGGDSPVIVVLNKFKEHRFELNEEALREKYPQIRAFIATDCKTNLGIRKLRQAVAAEIRALDSIKAEFPAAWFEIKERLSGMPEPFMAFDAFREICAEHGEKDKADQEQLAEFLHILGIALNYREDPRLRETSVLNPKWVTGGIYQLLNDDALRRRAGVMKPADLARILDAKVYPATMHEFLLGLMKKFELCFPLDLQGGAYLIPELLGKKQPKLGSEFDLQKCLCFEYHYGALLPEGLLPRFIVRAYTVIAADCHWRTGVVLEWKGARALVKADEAERQVLIRVHGPAEARRELLALVRDHFDEIHRNFKKLEPVEKIRLRQQPEVVVDYAEVEATAKSFKHELRKFWKGEWYVVDASGLLMLFELPGAKRGAAQRGAAEGEPSA